MYWTRVSKDILLVGFPWTQANFIESLYLIGITLQTIWQTLSPAVLFCLHVLPLSRSQVTLRCACQRRIIRSICAWRRIDGEDWEDTMRRIKQRVYVGMMLHHVMSWEERSHRALWSCARYLTHCKQTSAWYWMIRWQLDAMQDASLM